MGAINHVVGETPQRNGELKILYGRQRWTAKQLLHGRNDAQQEKKKNQRL